MTNAPSHESLKEQYELSCAEWRDSEDAELWDSTVGDGLEDEPERLYRVYAKNDGGGASRRRRIMGS
ncbi:hypothetical protein [Glycomyces paridis]|uniref:Uncharacterized protein n=1 Tax=Glycomyces paridis TaxID=2126555 RepID=A0A4S8PP93_9ACTN|nr:hypothetical protein [Glycomyces paridis]THV31555.1 hypothetical protein E9998_04120 [Glycomyces paridis]